MPYIKISFKSAKLFIEKKVGTDFVSDISTYFSKENYMQRGTDNTILINVNDILNVPIGFEQVSNMLHVLLGVRPVPSKRATIHKRLDIIDNIVKESWIRIDNQYYTINKNQDKKLITEFIQGKKIPKNSNAKGVSFLTKNGDKIDGYITWGKLFQSFYYHDNEKYNRILTLFKELYGNDNFQKDYSLIDFLLFLSEDENKRHILSNFFKENNLTPLAYIVSHEFDKAGSFNNADKKQKGYNLGKLQNNKSVKTIVTFDGEIVFKMNKELTDIIINGTRNATLLDGGHAKYIEKYDIMELSEEDLDNEGFKQFFI